MTKRILPMPKPPTHFVQIPVETVKKMAVRDDRKKRRPSPGNVVREPASRKTEPYSMGAHRLSLV